MIVGNDRYPSIAGIMVQLWMDHTVDILMALPRFIAMLLRAACSVCSGASDLLFFHITKGSIYDLESQRY